MPWIEYSDTSFAEFAVRCSKLFPVDPDAASPVHAPATRFCERFGMTRSALRSWRRKGRIPSRVLAELEVLEEKQRLEQAVAALTADNPMVRARFRLRQIRRLAAESRRRITDAGAYLDELEQFYGHLEEVWAHHEGADDFADGAAEQVLERMERFKWQELRTG